MSLALLARALGAYPDAASSAAISLKPSSGHRHGVFGDESIIVIKIIFGRTEKPMIAVARQPQRYSVVLRRITPGSRAVNPHTHLDRTILHPTF
jgi:hypothetical protein